MPVIALPLLTSALAASPVSAGAAPTVAAAGPPEVAPALAEIVELLELGPLLERLHALGRREQESTDAADVPLVMLRAEITGRVMQALAQADRVVVALEHAAAAEAGPLALRLLGPYLSGAAPSGPYPPLVWRYLGQAPPGALETRREQLLRAWRGRGLLPAPDGRRAPLLADVRAQVATLRADLARALALVAPGGAASALCRRASPDGTARGGAKGPFEGPLPSRTRR
jgi:hypothetical protein